MSLNGKKLQLSFNSPIILGFSIACFAVLLLDKVTGGSSTNVLFSVYRAPLLNPLTYLRFFGHVLGHAGWEHFISNIMMILVVGPLLEEKYGSSNILFVNKFYFFPACAAAWCKRCCLCIDFIVIIYQFQRGENTSYVYSGSYNLYWSTDIRRAFYPR